MFDVAKMLSPIMPHTTEEIYQNLFKKHEKKASIHHCSWPELDEKLISKYHEDMGEFADKIITAVRRYKTDSKLSLKTELDRVIIYSKNDGTTKQAQELADDLRTLLKIRAFDVFESEPSEEHKEQVVELDEHSSVHIKL